MSTTARRTIVARAATLAAAGALAVGLLPAQANAAPVADPQVSYLDCATNEPTTCDQILWSNAAVGNPSAPAAPTAVALTPTDGHYQAYTYDMSDDGTTWVAGLRHGPIVDDGFDSTTALVIVHGDPTASWPTATRVLSTAWDANPVWAAGSVWWLSLDTLYRFTPDFTTTPGVIGGTTVAVPAPNLVTNAPATAATPEEKASRLAISADGLSAAVLFHRDWRSADGTTIVRHQDRVVATRIATAHQIPGGTPRPYVEKTYDVTIKSAVKTLPSSNTFVFTDSTTLLFDEYTYLAPRTDPVAAVYASIPASGSPVATTTPNPALQDFYDVRPYLGGWWMWKDRYDAVSPFDFGASQFGSTSDLATAPVTLTDRADGDHTFRYVPTTVTPQTITTPVNRAAAHPHLTLQARTVATGRRVAYWGFNLYSQPPVGTAYVEGDADEVDRGTLHWQQVGDPVVHSVATSGATAFQIGLPTYLGYSPPLGRNTLFWWSYDGDLFTQGGHTGKVLVTVTPRVSAKVARLGAIRVVGGSTSRRGGTAVLYRSVGRRVVKVAAVRISPNGAFGFGRRRLAAGTYTVVTVADATWGAGTAVVKVP
jgi:hypothetical protein